MKKIVLAIVAVLCLSLVALAADVTGKWTAEVPGRNGTQTNTFTFKVSGSSVEGTLTTQRGDTPIANGKLEGDTLTFEISRQGRNGNSMTSKYTGKVSADAIEFTVETGRGPQTFTAKKAN
ncbi:MAG: hypothetical protein KGN84_15170 [Acidobacteriota bacterium]|nr:hypothetical protein [Acidobacteriota bacterium]